MSYFSALLLAAGLPVTLSFAAPSATVQPTSPVSTAQFPAVTSVSQAYQTMHQVGTSRISLPAAPAPVVSSPTPTPSQAPTTTSPAPAQPTKPVGGNGTGSGSNGGSSSSSTTPSSSSNSPQAMITLINQAREQAGLKPYTINPTLMKLAQERAVALASGPFTSDLPGYGWPVQMEQAAGIQAQGMGAENIAEASSVSQAFALLMASPPHKSNILNSYETQIGVGVAPWGSGVAISELFIGPNT